MKLVVHGAQDPWTWHFIISCSTFQLSSIAKNRRFSVDGVFHEFSWKSGGKKWVSGPLELNESIYFNSSAQVGTSSILFPRFHYTRGSLKFLSPAEFPAGDNYPRGKNRAIACA